MNAQLDPNSLTAPAVALHDLHPATDDIAADVRSGLSRRPKHLPSKYFYDARGSELFESICVQPEYYLTRTELRILRDRAGEIAQALGPRVRLVEYGSGAGIKTRLMLEALEDPVAYLPVEISRSALLESVAELAERYPGVEMLPVCADFTRPLTLPRVRREPARTAIFFPGSTLGNFDHRDACRLLAQMRAEMGRDGAAIVGIDLVKDRAELEAAYNDAAGVTAEFTLNLLARINRELGADFDLSKFRHRALYNPMAMRIETHIVSLQDQTVTVGDQRVHFAIGEPMLVEYSCKYTPDRFAALARRAGLAVSRLWTDADARFGIALLERA
ncbi:L-histidine N(alpha)-methyltransferase [Coralloluteibacterium stylophorae]|uniref:L-histidine N(Alpha)-methyltransferase n=1 Tax=Coralloluteibacterium stylophorae TaxID=1776034 RepID=A0A8J7VW18_9GAMM|nr:L-histidine N(alpha)-methyltransferase [Coralloluteibacterium stylophorae]MBS7457405.1 L-histidine N(alpha)-methyltransferase [Coralloluteibacterium stylophorae]